MKNILFSALIIYLVKEIYSGKMSFTANQKYSYVGKSNDMLGNMVINVDKQILAANTSNWKYGINYTISYPINLVYNNQTNLSGITVIKDFQFYYLTKYGIIIFTYLQQKHQTSMDVKIICIQANHIQKLSISYLLVYRSSFKDDFRINLIQIYNIKDIKGLNDSYYSNTFTKNIPTAPFNFTGGADSIGFISGIDVQSTKEKQQTQSIQIHLSIQVKSSTLLSIKINSPSSTASFSVILISIIVYNKGFYDQPYYFIYRFIKGTIKINNSISASYQNNKEYQMERLNTFVGLSSFKFTELNSFSFFQTVNSNKIDVSSTHHYDYAIFSFFVILTNYCSYINPYFESTTQTCYDKCPGSSVSDEKSLSCKCYVNNTIRNISQCNNPDATEPKLSATSLIISLSIGCTVSLILIMYCYKKSKISTKQNHLRIIIDFKQNQKRNPELQMNMNKLRYTTQSSDRIYEVQQPVYKTSSQTLTKEVFSVLGYPNLSKNFQSDAIGEQQQHYARTQRLKSKEQLWIEAHSPYQAQQLCRICIRTRKVFFKSSCSHYFHLQCVIKLKDKKCPSCLKQINRQGLFYCASCIGKYRKVLLDENFKLEDFQGYCDSCKKISL